MGAFPRRFLSATNAARRRWWQRSLRCTSEGVSTRKVTAISEELCGHSFSASAISEVSLTVRPAAPGERIVLSRAGVLVQRIR